MAELSIDSFLLVRAPAYSYENFNDSFLNDVLKTDFFKAALFFGSQTFYLELKKKDFNYELLGPAAKTTLWKYLNRMCYRALPYGLFSSYAKGYWMGGEQNDLRYDEEDKLIINPDFKVVTDQVATLDVLSLSQLKFYTNNSIYHSSGHLRFISRDFSAGHQFTVLQLKIVPGLIKLLKFISKGQSYGQVLEFLKIEYGHDVPAEMYLKQLLDQQVIVSSLLPNVTGQKYHERCISSLKEYSGIDSLNLIKTHYLEMHDQKQDLKELNFHIEKLISQQKENPAYVLYERTIQGGVNHRVKNELLRLVKDMDKLTRPTPTTGLDRFKKEFLAKYDQQEMPLLQVLDPESGIGYENLASSFDLEQESFIDDIKVKPKEEEILSWNEVARLLFKKWKNLKKDDVLLLTEDDLQQLPESGDVLSPGMAVLFKVINDDIWLDSIGGVSGIEILARFAASGSVLESNVKAICEQQVAINSDYIFAEIAFSTNDRTANINQRGQFYHYEIPILTHSTLPEDQVIRLDDLMISIKNDLILLRSRRLNQYITPRLSSAYNYRLSAIPLLVFLCDLQFQGVKANLSFSLMQLFPGLDYYPRVQLRSTVLSPATWLLNEKQLKRILAEEVNWLHELGITERFCLVEGDNFLVFDQNNRDDMAVFQQCVKNKKAATITECRLTAPSILKDKNGNSYAAQLVACVINQSKSYEIPSTLVTAPLKSNLKVQRDFLPGDEWLYIKIYAHTSFTDEILMRLVLPLTTQYKRDNPDFKWFFIRYLDPANHIRIRFFIQKQSYQLLGQLKQKLEKWSQEGRVSDIVIETYRRELEKYPAKLINEVESFFYRDTELILFAFRNRVLNKTYKLSFAVNSALRLIRYFFPEKIERKNFISNVLSNPSKEFRRDKELVQRLNLKYRKFQKELIAYDVDDWPTMNTPIFAAYERSICEIVTKIEDWKDVQKYNLLINLIHLHLNRIFESSPRDYEYVVYHFMEKHDVYLNYAKA